MNIFKRINTIIYIFSELIFITLFESLRYADILDYKNKHVTKRFEPLKHLEYNK
jgi:hypothetical protein